MTRACETKNGVCAIEVAGTPTHARGIVFVAARAVGQTSRYLVFRDPCRLQVLFTVFC